MKLITAVINSSKLDEVRERLTDIGIEGMTVSEVRGRGRQKGYTETYRDAEYTVHFLPKIKLEVAISDDLANKVIDAISTTAKTGQTGDGKIFAMTLDQAIRIRTGERDLNAL